MYFKQQTDNEELSLRDLSVKVCALLLLLVTAQRVQTIHLIKLSAIQFHERGCTVSVVDKLKHTKPGHFQSPLELSRHEEKRLCVVDCLKIYLKRTAPFRSDKDDKLLLCYSRPRRPASKDTV